MTAAYFHKSSNYPNNINLIESGLFHRFDATNILKENLASITCSISEDHLDWLPKDQQTIEKIRSVADIIDVVSNYVELKKRGRNFNKNR